MRCSARSVVALALAAWSPVPGCAADPGDPLKTSAAYTGDGGTSSGADTSVSGNSSGSSGGASSSSGLGSSTGSSGGTSSGSFDASSNGSSSGSSDAASMDVVVDTYVPPSCPTCPLKVDYFSNNPTETSTKEVRFYLDLVNNGTMVQDLTQITVRYWFTAEGSTAQTFNCDYAMLVCPTSTFVKMPMPTATADTYLELAFASGSIPPNGDTGQIQGRFHDTAYAVTLNQSNDYSFDPTKTTMTCGSSNSTPTCPWDHITMYRQGTLIWGIEPGGNSAGGDSGVTGADAGSDSGDAAMDAAGN